MLIGIDRELQHKAAGLRTHMLVSLGAASAVLIALQLDVNPSRVVQGVLTGIGFIGAVAILHPARHIEGVTTVASLWTCTMIGLAAGAGFYKTTVVTVVLAIFILAGSVLLERALRAIQKSDTRTPRPSGH